MTSVRHPRRGRRHRPAARGFGLLEAIVAIAILAGSGVALFSWINQNMQQAARLREREQQVRVQLSAQQLIETVNPMLSPKGQLVASGLAVSWDASVLQPERRNAARQSDSGPWQVGLYALRVQAVDRTTGIEVRFEQWRTGTRRLEPVVTTPP